MKKQLHGLTLIAEEKPSKITTVEITAKVGSNHEPPDLRGITHFIEHMLFEGTRNKTAKQITSEIESVGGEINAYTTNERVTIYIKILNKYIDKALKIISDIIQNPLFSEKAIEKEKKVILKEIDLCTDDPRLYRWQLFLKNLFKKHPVRNPIYGTKETVKNLKRKLIIDFYHDYFTTKNLILTIVGGIRVPNLIPKIKKCFRFGIKKPPKYKKIKEPKQTKIQTVKERRNTLSSYLVFGYKTVARTNPDSYVLDIIKAILGRDESGWLFDEMRNKRGLAYEIGVYHDSGTDYGYFATYLNTRRENVKEVISIIKNQFKKLSTVSEEDIKNAKGYIEGRYYLNNEDTQHRADTLTFWEIIEDVKLEKSYLKKIKSITKEQIIKTAKKYFNHYTLTLIE